MKYARASISFLLLTSLSVAFLGGCSFLSFKKSSDKTQAQKQVPVPPSPPTEWKERKWEKYAEDQTGTIYFFEKESVSYPVKNIIHVWRKRIVGPGARGLKEITTYDEIDCRTEKFRTLELQGTNADGTTTDIFRRTSPWSLIFQESADEYFLNNFCKEAGKARDPQKQ
jgi:hypothetical protein